jgi:hypothetical protein
MDEHKVGPESDMKTHKVDNTMLEDIAVPVRHIQGNQGAFLLMTTHQHNE